MDNNFFLNSGFQPQLHFDLSSDCFFNPNLDNSMDQFSQFESALTSMVSSPVSTTNSAVSNESFQMQELVGTLGTICDFSDILAPVTYSGSTRTSCYDTPMDSPPKLNYPITDQFMKTNLPNLGNSIPKYPPVPGDPGFAERAAKFSSFGSRSFNGRTEQLWQNNSNESGCFRSNPLMENYAKLTRVLSSPSLNVCGSQMGTQENTNLVRNQVETGHNQRSPVSTQIRDSNSKKRKAVSKETNVTEGKVILKSKRVMDKEENGCKTEVQKQENGSDNEEAKANTKPPEPRTDYIHVRARRGQATDSHSLAERVRREKIGERMKFLQDLVPGCNKVTGKALMLDEIINYVQSLQRQVEFLSMKVATVNPRLDFNLDSLISKDVTHPHGFMGNQIDTTASFSGHHNQKLTQLSNNNISNVATMVDPLHSIFHHNTGLQSSQLHEFAQGLTQFQTICEDDLQSIVRMGRNSQGFPGSIQTSHMKNEQ